MGLGREVADAYINVHGDLSKFRKDLERGRAVVSDQGELLADDFAEAMKKQDEKNMKDRWNALTKAFYSGKKLDWERVLGQFDGSNLGKQRKQITAFLADMQDAGYMTETQFKDADKAMRRALGTIADHRAAQEGITKSVADARFEQDRYNKSLKGMVDAADLDAFEGRWKKLGQTLAGVNLDGVIGDVDWSKMQKGTSSLEDFNDTMNDTIIRARLLGRVTDEQSRNVLDALDKYIDKERDRAKSIDESAASVKRMKSEADRARISLSGMIESAKTKQLENDFKKIAEAMASTNWGPVAKDHKSMEDFQRKTLEVTDRMRELGRVSDSEYGRVRRTLSDITQHQSKFNVELDKTGKKFALVRTAMDKLGKSWQRTDSTVRLVVTAIAAGASDLATIGSGLSGSVTAMVSSLAMAAGSIVPLAAAFGAMGVGVGLAVSGMDDLIAKFPHVQTAAQQVGEQWQAQAKRFGEAWGSSLDNLLSNFQSKLGQYDFGTPMGEAFSAITDSFNEFMMGPGGFDSFLQAMTTDLPAAVSGFGTGFSGVFGALFSLMAGAAPVAAKLGDDFQRWGLNLAATMEKARASGEMTALFERMRESLLVVLDLVGSVGNMLGTVFSLGASTGNSLLRSLTGIVDQFTAWMNTDAGRQTMLTWFQNAEQIIRSMEPLVVGLGKALAILVTPQSIEMVANLMTNLGAFLPILAEILEVISRLGIFNIIVQALLAVGQVLQPLLPHIGDLATLIGETLMSAIVEFTPLLVELATAFAPLLKAVVELASFIVPLLIPALRFLAQAITPLVSGLADAVVAVTDFLSSWDNVTGFFSSVGTAITDFNNTVNTALSDFWGSIGAKIAEWGAGLKASWDSFWGGLGSGIADLWNGMWESINAGLTQISTGWTEWTTGLSEGWNSFWNGLGEAVSAGWAILMTFLQTAFEGALTFFNDMFITPWNQFWTAFWEALPVGMQNSLMVIWSTIVAWFTNAQVGFNNFITTVTTAWNTFWGAIATYVSTKWNEMWGYINTGISVVVSAITGFITSTQASWNKFWGDVGKTISDAWNKFTTFVSDGVTKVTTVITTFIGLIIGKWNKFWGDVAQNVSNGWNNIMSNVQRGVSVVQSVISGFIGTIVGRWNSFWSDVSNKASQAMEALRAVVSNKLNEVGNFFRELPGKVGGALGGMAGQLFTVGTQMIQGLINGVRNMAGAVASAARGVVEGAINGAKALLGIHSPSRVFMEIGNFTGEGMAIGLDQMRNTVRKAAEKIADVATGAFDQSRMYVAGLDAANGLAKGLASNKSKIGSALEGLGGKMQVSGGIGTMSPIYSTPSAAAPAAGVGKQINISEGAIQVKTEAKNPETVAGILLDDIVTTTKLG